MATFSRRNCRPVSLPLLLLLLLCWVPAADPAGTCKYPLLSLPCWALGGSWLTGAVALVLLLRSK